MQTIQINIDVQKEVLLLLNQDINEFGKQLKLWAAIGLYQCGKLSIGRAATLSGLHRYDFENQLADLNIPISSLSLEDIEKELQHL